MNNPFPSTYRKMLITGGAGTLGRAIIHRIMSEGWDIDVTIYSTDAMKHAFVRRIYPQVRSVIGDIRDYDTIEKAIAGHDIVIHAAAVKHIPVSEENVQDTFSINVQGSANVALACIRTGVSVCVGISTDKACASHNAYGATKLLNEKIFQEFQWQSQTTDFYLVRYGNVIESTGSVVELWQRLAKEGKPIGIVDEKMTRFWLSPQQAVDVILTAYNFSLPGFVFIPKLPALSIGALADIVAPDSYRVQMPIRPGEKIHETMLTEEECRKAWNEPDYFLLEPSLYTLPEDEGEFVQYATAHYSSDIAPQMSKEQFEDILEQARELERAYGK